MKTQKIRNKLFGLLAFFWLVLNNPTQAQNNVTSYDGYRFTVLSSGLINIRKESESQGPYNYSSISGNVKFSAESNKLVINTSKCKLTYHKGEKSLLEKLQLEFDTFEGTVSTNLQHNDLANLGGIAGAYDKCDGRLLYSQYDSESPSAPKVSPLGLLSKRGWTVLKNINNLLCHGDIEETGSEIFVFCYGTDYKQALNDFVNVNGKIPLLPKWTLGNWFSRYQPLSDKDYREIVARFRKEKIPLDVLMLDMNWHVDGWYGTRYDSIKFPDMKGFMDWTQKNGLFVGVNHHPGGVNVNDPRGKTFFELNGLNYDSLKNVTEKIVNNGGWEGLKNTVSFGENNPDLIRPYFDMFLTPILADGADFHWVDGGPSIYNLSEYYKATENFLNKRSIVLTRQVDGSFNHHKFPVGFSGDTYISWESLKFNTEITIAGANVGVYWSHDIGGHMVRFGDVDHKELFTRWVQSGAMSPFNRLHATGGVEWDYTAAQERRPWEWGEDVLNATRTIMQLKAKLIPYTYTLARTAADNGLLMCHGMYIDYPQFINAYRYSQGQYMYGQSILVAPITDASPEGKGLKGKAYKNVWIPDGTWYDYFTGDVISGPVETLVSRAIDQMPLFIKEGAIIPMAPYMDYIDQRKLDTLIVEFYHSSRDTTSQFNLYEDDGISFDYLTQQYRWTKIEYQCNQIGSTITIYPSEGTYNGAVTKRAYNLIIKHTKKAPVEIMMNGKKISANNWMQDKNQLRLMIPETSVTTEIKIEIR